jgi:hypothetical protein
VPPYDQMKQMGLARTTHIDTCAGCAYGYVVLLVGNIPFHMVTNGA